MVLKEDGLVTAHQLIGNNQLSARQSANHSRIMPSTFKRIYFNLLPSTSLHYSYALSTYCH
ncbi:hypothetical protein BCR33DRAFT_724540, partial [Rhizoclosmatium globosum]